MHGIVVAELKKFVVSKFGGPAWNALLEKAGMQGRVFLPTQTYKDGEIAGLVEAAAALTGIPAREVMRNFGEFIAPELYRMYNAQINPSWKALDLIEHTEEMIHRQVRLKTPGAQPPRIRCTREAPDRIAIEYTSERKMCDVAKGIALGIGTHFGQTLSVSETECMLEGDQMCHIVVQEQAP